MHYARYTKVENGEIKICGIAFRMVTQCNNWVSGNKDINAERCGGHYALSLALTRYGQKRLELGGIIGTDEFEGYFYKRGQNTFHLDGKYDGQSTFIEKWVNGKKPENSFEYEESFR